MNHEQYPETGRYPKLGALRIATVAVATCIMLEAENVPVIAAPIAIARSLINLV